jgi:hypothetical protein
MRLCLALLGSVLVAMSSVAFGQPQPVGSLWRNTNGSIILAECPAGGDHDESCRAVSIRSGEKLVQLGGGYARVTVLWSRKGKAIEPDALVLGDYGGSGGNADLFAIRLSPRISFRKLGGERFDTATVLTAPGPLHLRLPFDVEFFNGAPHAGAIVLPLPVVWKGDDFAIDMKELTSRSYSKSELDFRELAMREELRAWAENKGPASRLYPPEARDGTPVTATAMIEMMLTGHADQARGILDRAWPAQWDRSDRPLGGKADFWAALCRAVISERSWGRFGLARLPHADLIESGANGKG